MEPLKLIRNTPEYKGQLDFLIKLEFKIKYSKYLKAFYCLNGWTILLILLISISDSNFFISIKAVLIMFTAIAWFVSLVFIGTIIYKLFKRKVWRDKTLRYYSQNDKEFTFLFDDKRIYFETFTYKTELEWSYYSFFAENEDTVFIFPPHDIYAAIYYSKRELGAKNYEHLKAVVTQKLVPLTIGTGI